MAWLVLPRTHTQRVILAQHYPRLLEHILYPGAGMTAGKSTTTGSAAPPSMAASVGHPAAATPAATAAHTAARGGGNGALPPRDAQGADRGASKSSLPPTKWRMLARVLKEGLARRSTQHARRLWKAGGHVRAGAGDNKKGWQQTKKPLRLRDRMQRVGLVMLTRRRLGGKDSSSPWLEPMRLAERRRRFDRTLDYFALADQACSGKCGINPAGVQETTAGFEEWEQDLELLFAQPYRTQMRAPCLKAKTHSP
eukprot:1138957-Pelagomonas_calceolata.AAC.3